MAWLLARRGASCTAALGLACLVVLCGCSAITTHMSGTTAASPTASAAVGSTATHAIPAQTAAATRPVVPPTSTTSMRANSPDSAATPEPSPSATAAPALPAALTDVHGLVYTRGTSVLQAGYLGGEAREIAAIPPYDAWAFDAGRLALALGPAIEVIDLLRGEQVSLRVEAEGDIEFADLRWDETGGTLLHMAVVADDTASNSGRRVELRAITVPDGRQVGLVALPDLASATILRYDGAAGAVTFIPRGGGEPGQIEIRTVAFPDGLPSTARLVPGEAEATLAPDGGRMVTDGEVDGGPGLWLHDLDGNGGSRGWRCVEGTRPVSPVWSPDGGSVAFLVQPDPTEGPEDENVLGLWVLDTASPADTLDVRFVMAESGAGSALIGWTPDGGYVLGYHQGDGGAAAPDDAYVFAVRPGGGDRHILNLGTDAVVLGWMPRLEADQARVAIDPWPARFAQAQQDATALAAVVAEYVAAHADQPDEALSTALAERLAGAGWQLDLSGPRVRHIDEGLYVAQFPPQQICLLEGGRAQPVASGDLIADARREGDALGLIYGMIGASAVQPGFVLLGRDDDATWTPRWSPQGQRDWIATDGEIRFQGEGLETLQVSGTSFGIDLGEADPFVECHACVHRELRATWARDGDGYARRSALAADAALPQVLWEMTVPAPHAVLHEALRRARAGEDVGDLATTEALAQLEALGLMAPGVRLLPEDVDAEAGSSPAADGTVLFGGEGGTRYRATVQGGRLVEVTTEND